MAANEIITMERSMPPMTAPGRCRMQLRFGVNETIDWQAFALGPHRESIWDRLRELNTQVIRILAFHERFPDPMGQWDEFAACLQGVLNAGAMPWITLAKFRPPYDQPATIRWFAAQCAQLVRRCRERWGDERLGDWFWCIWNQPNSEWISAGMTFEIYRRIYEETAQAIRAELPPNGRRARIGGPALDGFQPFWLDWIWRLVQDVDNELIGFVVWHRFGDWREPGAWGAPHDLATFRRLLMGRTPDYRNRAEAVSRCLAGRGIWNVCGELNAHAHHEPPVSRGFNQSLFGAAYYASALLNLMQGGADLELYWTGTDSHGPYGLLDGLGMPTPVFHAKALLARFLRLEDWLTFPRCDHADVDIVLCHHENRSKFALLVHRGEQPAVLNLLELTGGDMGKGRLLKLDASTSGCIVESVCDDTVDFEGYGVAVVAAG